MADYVGIIDFVTRRIVRHPDELQVRLLDEGRQTVVEITCAQEDMGKLIGKGGRNIDAIRAVGRAAGLRNGERVQVELAEDEDERSARFAAREQSAGAEA
ncbi:MAG: KH domain-containing protein [Candidatus Dormibacteria bacterium]